MDKSSKVTTNGKRGGNLVGKPHNDKSGKSVGGVKAVVTDAGGRPVELEGGEVIINKEASKKHWKELSRINQSAGNGVAIDKPIDPHDEDPDEFAKGGKIQFNPNKLPNKWILKYAQNIKKNHPEIWKKGGNIYGNQAFKNLERVSERGYWLDSEEWFYLKWQSFVARHKRDFRIAGVVAMLKWVDKVEKGWQYMKNLIEDEIKKIDSKRSKGGWTVSKNQRMSKGGEVVIDESIAENPLSDPKVGMALISKVDENEPFPMVYYVLSIKKNDSGAIQSLRVGFKDESYTFGISLDDFMRTYIPATKKQVNFDNKSGATVVPDIFKKGGSVDSYRDKYNRKYEYKKGTSHSLEDISKKTGVSLKGIQQIYNKGIGAYKTNPQSVRPNVKSKEQWAYARVYSSVMGGKAAQVDYQELKMELGGTVKEPMNISEVNLQYDGKWKFRDFPQFIENSDGQIFEKSKAKKSIGLQKGQYILAYYNKYNTGTDFFRVEGFGIAEDESSNGKSLKDRIELLVDSQKELFKRYKVKSLDELKSKFFKFRELNTGKEPILLMSWYEFGDPNNKMLSEFYYIDDNRWCRGSGSEPLSFIEYLPLQGDITNINGNSEINNESESMNLEKTNEEIALEFKKGDEISFNYDSSISTGNNVELEFVSKRRLKSGIVKYTFKNKNNPKGVKFYGYDRGNGLSFAKGDMAISNVSMSSNTSSGSVTESESKSSISYKVGDTGEYESKKPKWIEITKITEKNVYFEDESGKEKRSEKHNFERLFTPEEFFAPPSSEKSEFLRKANEQIEKWEESGYKEESNEVDYYKILLESDMAEGLFEEEPITPFLNTMTEFQKLADKERLLSVEQLSNLRTTIIKYI